MSFKSLFSRVYVEQGKDYIDIKIPNTEWFISDITRKWGSSKITNNIFLEQSKRHVRFELFFAVEIYYLVSKLLDWGINKKDATNPNDRVAKTSRNVLRAIKKGLEDNTWLYSIYNPDAQTIELLKEGRLDISKLSDMVFKPLDYQQEFIEYYHQHLTQYHLKGSLLFASPGTGKTYTSLAVANCLGNNIDHVIVISPNNALDRVWGASLDINSSGCLFKNTQSYWISKSSSAYSNQKYIVVNYEYLPKLIEIIKHMRNKKFMIILDESHNLNEVISMRTQLFMDLCRITQSNNIIMMSGTPIKALGKETIPLFAAIDPFFTDGVMSRFKSIYGMSRNVAADMLSYRLGLVTFKVEKKVLALAPPIHKSIYVSIPNGREFTLSEIRIKMINYIKEREEYYRNRSKEDKDTYFRLLDDFSKTIRSKHEQADYNQYLKDVEQIKESALVNGLGYIPEVIKRATAFEKKILTSLKPEYRKTFKDVKSIYKYVNLKIQGECLGNILGKERARCNVELAKYVDYSSIIDAAEKKTVIFTSFVDVIREVDKLLKKEGYKPIAVYGETNKELNSMLESFEKDPDINPLLATYQSLSTAVPLTMADNMILLNQPFREYILNQAISRIHRLNTDTQVYIYDILLDTGDEPNISTRSADILEWSQQQVDDLLGINLDTSIAYTGENTFKISIESLGYTNEVLIPSNVISEEGRKISNW